MKLLALDTATEACSVALLTEAGVSGRHREVGRGHAEHILDMVEEVLGEAGLHLGMLDGIASSVGPGSFTGVRICVSVVQGLAFGAQLPVVAVTTLEALAFKALRGGAKGALACLDARMGEVYWGCFAADARLGLVPRGAADVGPPASVQTALDDRMIDRPFQGIGRGFAVYPLLAELPGLEFVTDARNALPNAADMARLGALRLAAGGGFDAADLAPVYVREKVAQTEAERAAARALAAR